MKKITLLVDFTGVSELAVEHTAILARQSVCLVTLLHIADENKRETEKELKDQIREFASHLEKEGISFSIQINYGSFFDIIGKSIKESKSDLIVIGTHGIKGIKSTFFSSNIIKLIRLISIPAFIVQGHSQPPLEGYNSVLIPSLEKNRNETIKEPLVNFASVFNSSLHFLAYTNKDNEQQVAYAVKKEEEWYKEQGFKTKVQIEETSSYKSSYSKSIIQYADIEDIEVILLAFDEPGEEEYFDEEDIENILLNRLGKPVLCV